MDWRVCSSVCLSVLVMTHLISQEAVLGRRGGIFSSLLWTKLRETLDQNHLSIWNLAWATIYYHAWHQSLCWSPLFPFFTQSHFSSGHISSGDPRWWGIWGPKNEICSRAPCQQETASLCCKRQSGYLQTDSRISLTMDLAVLLLTYCLCDLFELHHCDQSSTVNVISFWLFAQALFM